jgi:HSP20 family protein
MFDLLYGDPLASMWPSWPSEVSDVFDAAFEVKETKDAFIFKADVPGIEPQDLEVKLENNRLSISGKREQEKTEKGDTYYACERSYGSFVRSFTLPEGVDAEKIGADLKNGVLTLTLPKQPEAKPKQISVRSG